MGSHSTWDPLTNGVGGKRACGGGRALQSRRGENANIQVDFLVN